MHGYLCPERLEIGRCRCRKSIREIDKPPYTNFCKCCKHCRRLQDVAKLNNFRTVSQGASRPTPLNSPSSVLPKTPKSQFSIFLLQRCRTRANRCNSRYRSMERNLSHLSKWFGKNGMKINAQKTQIIAFGTRQSLRQLPTVRVEFMGATVSGSPVVRNLGVVFDQSMTFTAHTDDVVRRCTGILIGLSHSRHSLPHSTLTALVQGQVISLIRYCISVYGICNATDTARLQKVLNFAARVISGRRKFDHISDVLRDLQWLTAHNMYQYHALTLLKRMLTLSQPESLSANLVQRRHVRQRTTRQDDLLHVPAIRTESGRRRFLYSTVTTFNVLPQNIRDMNMRQFKRELRRYLQTDS